MAKLSIPQAAYSVIETDVMDRVENFELSRDVDYRVLLRYVQGRKLTVPTCTRDREVVATTLVYLSNAYEEYAAAGIETRFARDAARGLTTLYYKVRAFAGKS